jgi:hypothetical protein
LYAHGLLDDFTQVSEKVFAAATCGRAFCAQLDGNGDPIDLTGAVMFEVIEDMAADRHLIACMREALEIIKQRLGVAEQGESLEAST